MTEMVTVRIDEETKRKIKRYGIPVSQVARDAIIREIEQRERDEALHAVTRMKQILKKVDMSRVVREMREDRTNR
jgi:antitoxin component of RelBE/YafQ-DinJ toxin-antitoxin module